MKSLKITLLLLLIPAFAFSQSTDPYLDSIAVNDILFDLRHIPVMLEEIDNLKEQNAERTAKAEYHKQNHADCMAALAKEEATSALEREKAETSLEELAGCAHELQQVEKRGKRNTIITGAAGVLLALLVAFVGF